MESKRLKKIKFPASKIFIIYIYYLLFILIENQEHQVKLHLDERTERQG